MKKHKMQLKIFLLTGFFMLTANSFSQDPNFYIYLCFGQSNMEGQGTVEEQDKMVDSRFRVMEAVNCSNLGRTMGTWYEAIPPLCRCWSRLSPSDYFGRTMVANLPDSIRVGVINVSVAGCKIELFDKDTYQDYVSSITEDWLINIINEYGGNPYGVLVDVAKLARQDGVIKGILLHQGESNTGDSGWPSKVKKIYNDLITDLELDADSIPLLAGEVVHADQGGICASMNTIIGKLPAALPNSYVISSSGCTDGPDNLHFDSEGYRELGRRYAVKMLSLMGQEMSYGRGTTSLYFEPECATLGINWAFIANSAASNAYYTNAKPGTQSIDEPPADSADAIYFPFSVDQAGNYSIYARIYCATNNDDSFWLKMDDGEFEMLDGLKTVGWKWRELMSVSLEAGEHSLCIAFREDGAKLDKINISDFLYAPSGLGKDAGNICDPVILTGDINPIKSPSAYTLGQNYPNPIKGKTNISFEIPHQSFVSLKVFNLFGVEIAELGGKQFSPGKHILEMDTGKLVDGNYVYMIRTDGFFACRKMVVLGY